METHRAVMLGRERTATFEEFKVMSRYDRLDAAYVALDVLVERAMRPSTKRAVETLRAHMELCNDGLAVRLQGDLNRMRADVAQLRDERDAAERLAVQKAADFERELAGQRTAFLSQIDDLEARLADNLAAKMKLHAEVERTRQAQAAISAFIGDLTDALATKAKGKRR